MALNDMTANFLDQKEVQRNNNALLTIDGVMNNGSPLQLAVESFPIPKTTLSTIEAPLLNESRKYAGKPTFDDLSVVFKDLIEVDIAGAINAWFQTVYDSKTGKIGFARNYKRQGTAELLGPDGSNTGRVYELRGVFPIAFDPGDIDMSGGDYVKINLTLSIDKTRLR